MFFPLIVASFFLKGVVGLMKAPMIPGLNSMPVIITFVFSTLISLAAFALVNKMGERHRMWLFGLYMIVPMTLTLMLLMW
jgi:hypothetical protein